ncbi:MAG TPA: hypothetical protein VK922_01955 [Gemmatimonadaceae bacterium]|nr:hypothetical protein [Gemmatimonadaceae bacterium]
MRLTTIAAWLLIAIVPVAAHGQAGARPSGVSFAPALVAAEGDRTVAARVGLLAGSRRHEIARAFPSTRYWRAEARGTLAADPDANPEPVALQAAGGIAISLARPRTVAFDPDAVDAPGRAMAFDYGDVSLAAQAHVETNQRRTEARAALGAELIYTHDRQGGVWPLVPSLYASAGIARPLASELRDTLGLPDDESYVRLVAGGAWHISADRRWMPRPFRPVWLHAQLDLYREADVDAALEQSRLDDGARVALGAAYRLLSAERRIVDEIFIRWTNGETPTLPAARKAWMLGIVLAP